MRNEGIYLGLQPETLRILLTTGSDFHCILSEKTGAAWDVGASIKLDLDGTVWAATISGADATWIVDKAQADLILAGTKAKLIYTNGSVDQVWAVGEVVRSG